MVKENNKISEAEVARMMLEGLTNLRTMLLKRNPHIKKYYKYRNIHSEVLNSMIEYIDNGKFDLTEELNKNEEQLLKETDNDYDLLTIDFDLRNDLDFHLFIDFCVYKNHPGIKSVTEHYIDKNKFRNEEKIKMLNAMNNSIISFFKILKCNYEGFVEVEDVVTGKIYKIIDIALSSSFSNSRIMYFYSRLFTIDDISFLSSFMSLPTNNKKINNYVKKCKCRNKSKLVQTLEVYNLNKEYGFPTMTNIIK